MSIRTHKPGVPVIMGGHVWLSGRVTACRSCGAHVRFVTTQAGKTAIVDADPAPNGNLVATGPGHIRYASKAEPAPVGAPLYLSHWASCKDAAAWRRRFAAEAGR